METNEFIDYILYQGWNKRWCDKDSDSESEDFNYEISYADFIYDELTVWNK